MLGSTSLELFSSHTPITRISTEINTFLETRIRDCLLSIQRNVQEIFQNTLELIGQCITFIKENKPHLALGSAACVAWVIGSNKMAWTTLMVMGLLPGSAVLALSFMKIGAVLTFAFILCNWIIQSKKDSPRTEHLDQEQIELLKNLIKEKEQKVTEALDELRSKIDEGPRTPLKKEFEEWIKSTVKELAIEDHFGSSSTDNIRISTIEEKLEQLSEALENIEQKGMTNVEDFIKSFEEHLSALDGALTNHIQESQSAIQQIKLDKQSFMEILNLLTKEQGNTNNNIDNDMANLKEGIRELEDRLEKLNKSKDSNKQSLDQHIETQRSCNNSIMKILDLIDKQMGEITSSDKSKNQELNKIKESLEALREYQESIYSELRSLWENVTDETKDKRILSTLLNTLESRGIPTNETEFAAAFEKAFADLVTRYSSSSVIDLSTSV